MHTIKTRFLALSFAVLCLSPLTYAGGSRPVGALESTQLINKTQLIAQVKNMIEQLQIMNTNLKKLKEFMDNGEQLLEELSELSEIINVGQALAYDAEHLSDEFSKRFEDFDQFVQRTSAASGFRDAAFEADRYQKWARQNLDNVHSALRAVNFNSKYFKSQAQTLKEIEHHAKTAVGRDQLLQAGIEITALQVKQLQSLQQLMSSDIQMQANYQASLIDRQAEADAIKAESLKPYDGKDSNPKGYYVPWEH